MINWFTFTLYLLPKNTPIPWKKDETARTVKSVLEKFPFKYPMTLGTAIKIESKRAVATACLTPIPKITRRGITRIGPPAPDKAQIAAVIIPIITTAVVFGVLLSKFYLSLRRRIEIPESRTTIYNNIFTAESSIIELRYTPKTAPIKLEIPSFVPKDISSCLCL